MCVCMCTCTCVHMHACIRERERERESVCVFCVCVHKCREEKNCIVLVFALNSFEFIYNITKPFSNFWINQPEPWEAVHISHKYKFLYLKTYEYTNTFSMWQRGSQKVSRKSVQYPVFMIVKYGIVLDICHSSNFLATAHDLDLDGYISLGHVLA